MCGNPLGKPALFLHGGPGGGCSAINRRFFDPQRYRIILYDQRGCGRSLPHAHLEANTTAYLVRDIEALRTLFNIDRWLILGGSWGATLALVYAEAFSTRVSEMVLRGIFTARQSELRWLYQSGASFLFPEEWDKFVSPVSHWERGDMISAYHERLTCGEPQIEILAARSWCAWEDAIMTLEPQPGLHVTDDSQLVALARIETHFFMHACFLKEGQLIADAHRLHGIPCKIVQGRYDAVTPPVTAWDLHRAWPHAELQIVPDAGHASSEPGNLRGLLAATDAFSRAT
jgi:proline iminopeptidase